MSQNTSPSGNDAIMTPWGMSDYHNKITEGIDYYSTPSHGGFLLDPEHQAHIPAPLRLEEDGMAWYEHDIDWLRIALVFPEYFPEHSEDEIREILKSNLRNWNPDVYEVWTGEKIEPGQSIRRDHELFAATHAEDYVVLNAEPFVMNPTVLICTACKGGRMFGAGSGRGPQKIFLVSVDEYGENKSSEFIIDPLRHPEMTPQDLHRLEEEFEKFCLKNPEARIPLKVRSTDSYCQENPDLMKFLSQNYPIADADASITDTIIVFHQPACRLGQSGDERIGYCLVTQSEWRQRDLAKMTIIHPEGVLCGIDNNLCPCPGNSPGL